MGNKHERKRYESQQGARHMLGNGDVAFASNSGVTLRNEHVASQFRGILAAFSSQGRAYEAAEERRECARNMADEQ